MIMDFADLVIILGLPLETQQYKRKHLFPNLRMRMETKLSSPALVSENFSGQDYKRASNEFHDQLILCKLDMLPSLQRGTQDSPKHFFEQFLASEVQSEMAHRTHQPRSR